MPEIHTVLNVFLYVLVFFLVFSLAAATGFLIRKFTMFYRDRVSVKSFDLEANNNNFLGETKSSPPCLPADFYLDPVVYPSAVRRSSKQAPSQRIISNPYVPSRPPFIHEAPTRTITAAPKNDQLHRPSSAIPIRPPRPTRLDDLLAGFPYEKDVTRDIWLPLVNKKTGCWELAVVRNAAEDFRDNKIDLIADTKGKVVTASVTVKEANAVFPSPPESLEVSAIPDIHEREVQAPPPVPNVGDHWPKNEESFKRHHSKKARGPIHTFEIPELLINARPYAEIEAEETRAAASFATSCT